MSEESEENFVKVIYPFTAARKDELTIKDGDIVKVLDTIDPTWSRGETRNAVGVFPINHTTPLIRAPSSGAEPEMMVRAVFNFNGDKVGDLKFKVDELIVVVREVNEDWFEGRLNGKCGIFPKSFVQVEKKNAVNSHTNNKHFMQQPEVSLTTSRNQFMRQPIGSLVTVQKGTETNSSSGVTLRNGKKPVARPRTAFIPKSTVITDASTANFPKDDLFVKQSLKPQPRPRIVSCDKPAPKPRPYQSITPVITMTMDDVTTSSSTRTLSFDINGASHVSSQTNGESLLNGFHSSLHVCNMKDDFTSNGLANVTRAKPIIKPKPKVAPKPPVAAKPTMKVKQKPRQSVMHMHTSSLVTWRSGSKQDDSIASSSETLIDYKPSKPAPQRPSTQVVLPQSMTSELLIDINGPQHTVRCSSQVKPVPRPRNVSKESTAVHDGEQHFLSPSRTKPGYRDSLSSHDSGISVIDPLDVEQKIKNANDRLRLEMKMVTTIETTLKHIGRNGSTDSPPLRMKMQKCKDNIRHLKADLKELEGMKRCECDDNAAFGLPSAVLSDDSDQQSNWVIGDCAGSSVASYATADSETNTSETDDAIDVERVAHEDSPSLISFDCDDAVAKRARTRVRVIAELIDTERKHVTDLNVGYNKIQIPLKNLEIDGFDVETLFGNLKDVLDTAQDFLNCLIEKQHEDKLGECFINKAERLLDVYSKYSCNNDDASALLEKYVDMPDIQQAITACLLLVKDELTCWPLSALLIKPVQRILKYPLLLNELIKCTEADHPDRTSLLKAADLMSDVAQEVNESKRRKDLVQHYRRSETDGLLTKFGKLNLRTWKKKTQRARQMVSQGLGFSLGTVDEQFNQVYNQFRELEFVTNNLIKNVSVYMSSVESWHQSHVTACQAICEFYSERASEPAVVQFSDFHKKLLTNFNSLHVILLLDTKLLEIDKILDEQVVQVDRLVLTPLRQLKSLFESPTFLIEKREDKLLDYDSWKNKVSNTQNKEKVAEYKEEMVMAERMYEALNTQLLEDLPLFVAFGVKVIQHGLTAFIRSHRQHIAVADESIKPLMQCGIVNGNTDDLLSDHLSRLAAASDKLVSCHCIPNGFLTSVNLQQRKVSSPKTIRQASTARIGNNRLLSTSPRSLSSSPISQRAVSPLSDNVQDCPSDGDCLYRVEFSYTACGDGELSVREGDVVTVKQKNDHSGSREWWFIQLDDKNGFVPASYLVPFGEDVYCVEYDFDGDNDSELSVRDGQYVRVQQQHDVEGNPDWWLCEIEGQSGYIPSSYLTRKHAF